MASVTIGDILQRGQEFELRIESYYATLRDTTQDNGVKLLTYYLSRHRRHIERALEALGPQQLERVNAVRLKIDVPFELPEEFADGPRESVNGASLLSLAIHYDAELIDFYKRVAEQPVGEEAGSLVGSLVSLEEKDIVMLKKMAAMHYF